MPKRTKLTLEQHRALGLRIEVARLIVMRAYIDAANAHPIGARHVKLADTAHKAIDKLKSALDDLVFTEFPSAPDPAGCCYGHSEEAAAVMAALFGDSK